MGVRVVGVALQQRYISTSIERLLERSRGFDIEILCHFAWVNECHAGHYLTRRKSLM